MVFILVFSMISKGQFIAYVYCETNAALKLVL